MMIKYFLKYALFFTFIFSNLIFSANAETCGICKESYVSCISSGSSLSSCNSRLRSCESACFGNSDSSNQSTSIDKSWIFLLILIIIFYFIIKIYYDSILDKRNAKNILKNFKSKVELEPESTPFSFRQKKYILNKIEKIFISGQSINYSKSKYENISTKIIIDFISHNDFLLKNVKSKEIEYEKKIKIILKNFTILNVLYVRATNAKLANDQDLFIQILNEIFQKSKPLFEKTFLGIDINANLEDLIERAGYNEDIYNIFLESKLGVGIIDIDLYLKDVFKKWKV